MSSTFKARRDRVQAKIIKNARKQLKKTGKTLITMATGTGKTVVAVKLLKALFKSNPRHKVLWITHRNELIEQARRHFDGQFSKEEVGAYSAAEKDFSRPITVASIATISRKNYLRELRKQKFTVVCVDEAHHAPADTWSATIEAFDKAKRIGLTATPVRPDEKDLTSLFGEIAEETGLSLRDAIDQKLLAKPNGYVILTDSVIEGIYTTEGDFSPKALDRLVVSEERDDIIVKSYLKYGRKAMKENQLSRKTVCFCINTAHAERLCNKFKSRGVPATFLSGNSSWMSPQERADRHSAIRDSDKYEVVCVVDLYNEGVDIPEVGCLLMCRPTRSNIIYTQQLGRGTRRIEGKKDSFAVLDFVDNTRKGFSAYTCSTATKCVLMRGQVVTEYLKVPDSVQVEERVQDVIKNIEDFEFSCRQFWTDRAILQDAKLYFTRTAWMRASPSAYQAAHRRGKDFLEKCCQHMRRPSNVERTFAEIAASAKRHNTLKNWIEKDRSGYFIALRKGWIPKVAAHLERGCRKGIKQADIAKSAKKCKTLSEFRHRFPADYSFACRTGLLRQITGHMDNKRAPKRVRCIETGIIYPTVSAAANAIGVSTGRISSVAKGKRARAKGLKFEYVD